MARCIKSSSLVSQPEDQVAFKIKMITITINSCSTNHNGDYAGFNKAEADAGGEGQLHGRH